MGISIRVYLYHWRLDRALALHVIYFDDWRSKAQNMSDASTFSNQASTFAFILVVTEIYDFSFDDVQNVNFDPHQ